MEALLRHIPWLRSILLGHQGRNVLLCVPAVLYRVPARATARSMHATVARQSLQAVRQLSAEFGRFGSLTIACPELITCF